MRRLTAAAILSIVGGVSLLPSSVVAAPTGSIEGRVVNESTGRAQPGVELTLTTGTSAGESETVATVRSDADGRYHFEDLETGEDRFYALDARFADGLFAGRPITLPSNTSKPPVIDSTLRVWNTTTEPGVMAIKSDRMFVVHNSDGLGVIESVTFVNTSNEAYIGRGAELLGDSATGASFAFALPPGSTEFNPLDSTLDIPDLVEVDQGLATTIAIPPGENKTTFSYRVSGSGGSFDLSRPAFYPTLAFSIYAAEPLEIRSNRLVEKEGIDLEGKSYAHWSADEPIDAGDPLQAIAVASGTVPLWPIAAAAAGVLLVGTVAAVLLRRKRRPSHVVRSNDRNQLLENVALLDLAFESGEIDRDRWDKERGVLLQQLRDGERAGA
jgi:hypothetical protein